MIPFAWHDWAAATLTFFVVVTQLWLGLTVLLNAERRRLGTWLAGGGLVLGGTCAIIQAALLGAGRVSVATDALYTWRWTWLPVAGGAWLWAVVVIWYVGRLRTPADWCAAIALSAPGPLVLLLLVGVLAPPELGLPAAPALALGAYVLFAALCIAASLLALCHPRHSDRLMGDLAARRARPWLTVTSLVALGLSVVVGTILSGLPLAPSRLLDLAAQTLHAVLVVLMGQAIVSYELFTGKALPRRGLARYWRNALILAAGFGGLLAASLELPIDTTARLLLASIVVSVFYALLGWRTFAERERSLEQLRPFVWSERLVEQVLEPAARMAPASQPAGSPARVAEGKEPASGGTLHPSPLASGPSSVTPHPWPLVPRPTLLVPRPSPLRSLRDDLLGASVAYLYPLGPLAPLVGPPLADPPTSGSPAPGPNAPGDPSAGPAPGPAAPDDPPAGSTPGSVSGPAARPAPGPGAPGPGAAPCPVLGPPPSEALVAEILASASTRPGASGPLCLPIDPARYGGAAWAVPLWNERGPIGLLLLGEKRDGGLYAQEELEIARAAAERLLDARAVGELARRLLLLQRRRLAEDQIVDSRVRRALHDDVLPLLHTALLLLSSPPRPPAPPPDAQPAATTDERPQDAAAPSSGVPEPRAEVAALLADAHRQVSALLAELPPALAPDVARIGLVGALRRVVDDLADAFDGVTWAVEPAGERAARALSLLGAEVLFGAAREAIRNAARHGRGGNPARRLHLTVAIGIDSAAPDAPGLARSPGPPHTPGLPHTPDTFDAAGATHPADPASGSPRLVVRIEDDGVGFGHASPTVGGGQGLALHGTLLAVLGGSLAAAGAPGAPTRVTLTL